MPVLLDTSFIIALADERDVHHNKALALQAKIDNSDFGAVCVSDYVFDEVIAVALRKQGKQKATALGNDLVENMAIVGIDRQLWNESWQQFKKSDLNLTLTDWTNTTLAKAIGETAIATFDKEFKKVSGIKVLD